MNITVILCTYQRCSSLARTLSSVACSVVPEGLEWEVLVVDNNSTDQTRQVVEAMALRYPGHFRYWFEPTQGKSHALNTGVREARGRILAFLDDDVTVAPDWLYRITAALQDGKWVGSGGRILPQEGFAPPPWLSIKLPHEGAPLALFERGLVPGPLNEPPFGTNMAFQRSVFEKYGGFRLDLGPQPGNEIRSEDTEFCRRVLNAGEKMYYEPAAVVYHPVSASRVQKEYILTWWFDKSRADVRAFGVPSDSSWFVWGAPWYLFRRAAVWTLRWWFTFQPSRRFDAKLNVYRNLGTAYECYRQSRRMQPARPVGEHSHGPIV